MTSPSPAATATLLIAALNPDPTSTPSLKSALRNALLTRPSLSQVHILATSPEQVKSLRLEAYTVAGQAGRDVSVTTSDVGADAEGPVPHGVAGVLLALPEPASGAFLDLDEVPLRGAFEVNVGLVQKLARATMPELLAVEQGGGAFFALMEGESGSAGASLRVWAMDEVRRSVEPEGKVLVGFVDDVLPPPVVEEVDSASRKSSAVSERRKGMVGAMAGMRIDVPPLNGGFDANEPDAGESPTKLWAEWALQEEMI